MVKFIKKNFNLLLFILCIILFLAFAEDVFTKEIMQCDVIGYRVVSNYIISDKLTPIIKIVTNFGGAIILGLITILILILIKNKKIGLSVLINLCSVTVLNLVLKSILQRPRPNEYRIINETGYSFPSGHSMISMAFYGFIIYYVYCSHLSKLGKTIIISILTLLVLMIGLSRIYLGVHYASDVIGGFVLALVYLIIFIKYIYKKEKKI